MPQRKQFWLYSVLSLAICFAVLAIAIWDSSDAGSTLAPVPASLTKSARIPNATLSPSSQPLPDDFPAPAKKLHKVITSPEFQPTVTNDLPQQIQQLDQQLSELDQQLQAQGVPVPDKQTPPVATDQDTAERLKAIQQYMSEKAVGKNTDSSMPQNDNPKR
jgi:hypothetical protein